MNNERNGNLSRRHLLKHTLMMASAGLLPAAGLSAGPQPKKLGIALVGLGYYSTDLLGPALQHTQNCYLAGIVTGTPAKAQRWQKHYQLKSANIYNYENFDSIAKNPDIDIVYVVLPNSMHKEFTLRAARAGKHVICEKPMALNAKECEEMIRGCEDAGVRLTIGYRLHFEPYTQHLMKLGKSLPFGDIKLINATAGIDVDVHHNPQSWRWKKSMGGGWLLDIGVYAIQAARYCKQREPVAVSAQSFNTRPQHFVEIPETTNAQLTFADGSLANVVGSGATFASDLHVKCERNAYQLSPFWTYSGLKGGTRDTPFNFPHIPQQVTQMDAMAASIRDNTPFLVSAEEGLQDMRIIDAIEKSIALGGKSVKLA